MNTETKTTHLTEEQIDEIVIAQAEDDAAWEEPILVRRFNRATISLPSKLAKRGHPSITPLQINELP
jgi:hypothetical protein